MIANRRRQSSKVLLTVTGVAALVTFPFWGGWYLALAYLLTGSPASVRFLASTADLQGQNELHPGCGTGREASAQAQLVLYPIARSGDSGFSRLLQDSDEGIRTTSTFIAGRSAHPRYLKQLTHLAQKDSSYRVREAATLGIAQVALRDSGVQRWYDDEVPSELSPLAETVVASLREAQRDPDPHVVGTAAMCLVRLGRPDREKARQIARDYYHFTGKKKPAKDYRYGFRHLERGLRWMPEDLQMQVAELAYGG